jgi:outer membrane lipoprotein LolB
MRRSWLRAAAVVTLALSAACRTTPPTLPPSASWESRRAQLQAREHFRLQGRVAVAANGEGFNASLRWTQEGERTEMTLEGPLGVGGVQLTATGNELRLVTSHGEVVDNAAAHEALVARLGFDPPLAALRYWALGVPDPDPALPATESLDPAQQRLSALTQGGWRIDYQSYTSAAGEILPARLTLQRETVRVRLLVDGWQL